MLDRVSPVVLLATSAALADLTPDDRLFAAALARRGATARAAVWNDQNGDWNAQAIVLRSTWDYFLSPTEFLGWATRVAAGALLQNPLPVVAWNAHKQYLSVLQARGVPIIDTVFASRGEAVIFIGGRFSHGIRRRSVFSMDEHMPAAAREIPSAAALCLAERVLAEATMAIDASRTSCPLLYARVDLAERSAGEWVLLELELIEPSLFFRQAPEAAGQMADLLLRRL